MVGVWISHNSSGRGGGRGGCGGDDTKCYECGEPGHFAPECRLRIDSRGLGSGRRRSPSPRYRRSPSYGRRSYNPHGKSPRGCSLSPHRGRSYSRSPPNRRGRYVSPYANGLSPRRGRGSYSRSPAYSRYRDSPYANGLYCLMLNNLAGERVQNDEKLRKPFEDPSFVDELYNDISYLV